jgi:hypothetical protein
MRLTIAQMMRWAVYAAVALSIAVPFSRAPWPRVWFLEGPLCYSTICLAWALLSLFLLKGPSRAHWSRFWCVASAGGLAFIGYSVLRRVGNGTNLVWVTLGGLVPVVIHEILALRQRRKPVDPTATEPGQNSHLASSETESRT